MRELNHKKKKNLLWFSLLHRHLFTFLINESFRRFSETFERSEGGWQTTPRPVWVSMCETDGKDRVNMTLSGDTSPTDPLQTSVCSENVIRGQLVGGHFDTCLIFGVRSTIYQQWRMVETAWGVTDTLL